MTISLENLGFGLYREETRNGSKLFALELPFRLLNGAPFDVFVEQIGESFHIFDDGLTMHEIISVGIDMSNHHKWTALRKIVSQRNVNLSHSGVFELYSPIADMEAAVSDYLRAMFSVDEWLAEHAYEGRPSLTLVEESKKFFKRWKHDEELIDKPKVNGISGTQLEFDFKIGNRYVDAIAPTASACGGYVRKILTIDPSIRNKIETIAVIDDRFAPDAAKRERNIMASLSSTIMLSRLMKNAEHFGEAA